MLYKCEHCNYTTKRIRDLNRHINRKTPCYKKNKEQVCNCGLSKVKTTLV